MASLQHLLKLRRSQDLDPQCLTHYFEFLGKRYQFAYFNASSGDFPLDLIVQECAVLYVEPYSVLVGVKLKTAVTFGQVSGVMLSRLETTELNSKLLKFRRALTAARGRAGCESVSFRKYADIEVKYKQVQLLGSKPEGIRLLSAVTALAKLPLTARADLATVKRKLIKPVTEADYEEMIEEYTDFVAESCGMSLSEVSWELNKLHGIFLKPISSEPNTAASSRIFKESALRAIRPAQEGKYSETEQHSLLPLRLLNKSTRDGDKNVEADPHSPYKNPAASSRYLIGGQPTQPCRIPSYSYKSEGSQRTSEQFSGVPSNLPLKYSFDESQSFSRQVSLIQDQAYLSKDTDEESFSPRLIEFTRQTPQESNTPLDSDDSYLAVLNQPDRKDQRLETVAEHSEDKRSQSLDFLEEDLNEDVTRRPVLANIKVRSKKGKQPPTRHRDDTDELREIGVIRVHEHDELIACCSCDGGLKKVCLLF